MGETETKPRIPPGQRITKGWPVLSVGPTPIFNPQTWSFEVSGEVERPFKLSWAEFQRLPRVKRTADFHCVTGWSRLDNVWEGVAFRTIAEKAGLKPTARHATIGCENDYTTSQPLSILMEEDVLFADTHDGRLLESVHGGPLRLIVPKIYAYKSAKWVRWVRFTAEEELGFWEVRGYSQTADPWTEDRYA